MCRTCDDASLCSMVHCFQPDTQHCALPSHALLAWQCRYRIEWQPCISGLSEYPPLCRLSAAGGDNDSVGPGSAFSLQAVHGSEGQSEQDDEPQSQEVTAGLTCASPVHPHLTFAMSVSVFCVRVLCKSISVSGMHRVYCSSQTASQSMPMEGMHDKHHRRS